MRNTARSFLNGLSWKNKGHGWREAITGAEAPALILSHYAAMKRRSSTVEAAPFPNFLSFSEPSLPGASFPELSNPGLDSLFTSSFGYCGYHWRLRCWHMIEVGCGHEEA